MTICFALLYGCKFPCSTITAALPFQLNHWKARWNQ